MERQVVVDLRMRGRLNGEVFIAVGQVDGVCNILIIFICFVFFSPFTFNYIIIAYWEFHWS